MAGLLNRLMQGLSRLMRRKKPEAPKPKRRQMVGTTGIPVDSDLSEAQRQQRVLSGDEVYDFVHNSVIMFVHSSNVGAVQYFKEDQKLMVEFLPGANGKPGRYLYSNVTEDDAISFARAGSKGKWVWDNLRVRGSKTAHRKPYIKL